MVNTKFFHLLVVDDDALIQQAIRMSLPPQWKMNSALSLDEIPVGRFYHAALVDMHLEKNSKVPHGLKAIKKLTEENSQIEVIAMSGDVERELMESCLKAGAQRFLAKPILTEEMLLMLEKIEAYWSLRTIEPTFSKDKTYWIGDGPSSQKIKKQIASLKGENRTILIEGETGTGKEVVSHMLHQQEGDRPFITVNIASIPENLFESELFGHVKGAFTGADQNKVGLTEAAHGGDLLLDEIEALPMSQQVKLLRFIESGEIRKVGAKETQKINVRVIAASNQPLVDLVKNGSFREDLYFRLSSQKILLPPLHQRKEDIDLLVEHFLSFERPKRNKKFSPDGIESLKSYSWPGNVRELKRVCEQLILTSPLPIIRDEDVNSILRLSNSDPQARNADLQNVDLTLGINKLVAAFESEIIKKALKITQKDIEKAASLLQISKSNLYKKVKDYNIQSEAE